MSDPFSGSLTFVRVYAGTLSAGSYVLNANKRKKERIGRLLEMHANSREDVKVALAGDIIALAGFKDTITGEILCVPDNHIMLERMDFPDPVVKVAIEPKTKADVDKMATGLIKLAQEDLSFHFSRDEEINQTVIEGMGELHLEISVDQLKREFKVIAPIPCFSSFSYHLICSLVIKSCYPALQFLNSLTLYGAHEIVTTNQNYMRRDMDVIYSFDYCGTRLPNELPLITL